MRQKNENVCIPKKILFVGFGEEYGGVEQLVFSLCDSTFKDKYEFDFLSYYHIPEITREKILHLNSNWYYVTRYSKNLFRFFKEIFSFYISHPEYKIVYCNANHASMIMYTLPLWFSRKIKIVFHSHVREADNKFLHKLFRILVNWRCDLRIACSGQAAEWMYGKNKNVQIVYNGIDIERFKYDEETRKKLRNQYGLNNRLVIGHVGRLTPVKNHLFLIDVFNEILRINPNAFLVLIGDGELYDEIKARINQLALDANVLMLAFQTDIHKFYQMMDMFILPSIAEGFGLSGIEALTSGVSTFYSDGIPNEFDIKEFIHYISLDKTAREWAEEIMRVGINKDRTAYFQELEKSALNKTVMVKKIQELLDTFYE